MAPLAAQIVLSTALSLALAVCPLMCTIRCETANCQVAHAAAEVDALHRHCEHGDTTPVMPQHSHQHEHEHGDCMCEGALPVSAHPPDGKQPVQAIVITPLNTQLALSRQRDGARAGGTQFCLCRSGADVCALFSRWLA